ncbi:MAG: PEGA domain-containing protein [Bacteroidetes bacterium]|nr:PEGA domain-containing protein [Bacteroidota bacterium]
MKCIYFIFLVVLFSSCATIFSGARQSVIFITNPEGASVSMNMKPIGVTPFNVKIKKRIREPEIEIKKEGYKDIHFILENRLDWLACMNLLNIYGWGIDYLTGAIKYYPKDEFIFNLGPNENNKEKERFLILTQVKSFQEIVKDENMIRWDDTNKLKFEHFTAPAPSFSKATATTSANFSCYFINDAASNIRLKVFSRFYKDLSWFKSPDLKENREIYKGYLFNSSDKIVSYVLNHEQRHFDIAELYSRILKSEIKNHQFKKETFQQELSELFNKTYSNYVKKQNEYDNSCGHGLQKGQQKNWNKNIDELLKKYGNFKGDEIEIDI